MAAFDVGHAAEDLARMAADLERRAGRFQELEGRMQALTVTESSRDGRVGVTVDSSGVPTAIDLSPSSRGMDPAALSAEIMSCIRRAQSSLRTRVTELVRDTVGDDEVGAAITAQYAQRFPDPEPPAPSEDRTPGSPRDSAATMTPTYAPPGPAAADATSFPRGRKPNRDQIVVPDEPDPETEYYNRSWLV
ncbi:YbaB/EbfC family nucleoid-associated protein [Nocardia beijingensis]|uniref:YbaB/EbfC family nucleoid-associated protein n=1 Tax=Nocardia beijingensis TaxID=95162 RepID=UPI00344BC7B5